MHERQFEAVAVVRRCPPLPPRPATRRRQPGDRVDAPVGAVGAANPLKKSILFPRTSSFDPRNRYWLRAPPPPALGFAPAPRPSKPTRGRRGAAYAGSGSGRRGVQGCRRRLPPPPAPPAADAIVPGICHFLPCSTAKSPPMWKFQDVLSQAGRIARMGHSKAAGAPRQSDSAGSCRSAAAAAGRNVLCLCGSASNNAMYPRAGGDSILMLFCLPCRTSPSCWSWWRERCPSSGSSSSSRRAKLASKLCLSPAGRRWPGAQRESHELDRVGGMEAQLSRQNSCQAGTQLTPNVSTSHTLPPVSVAGHC